MRETIPSFKLIWRKGAYYVSEPNVESCDVVRLADHIERIAKAEARIKVLEEALRGVKLLFAEPSPFYIKKLGGPITNGDQKKIDAVFIAIGAALREDR